MRDPEYDLEDNWEPAPMRPLGWWFTAALLVVAGAGAYWNW